MALSADAISFALSPLKADMNILKFITVRTVANRVGIVTLNRPQQLNALNGELMDELGGALRAFDADAR